MGCRVRRLARLYIRAVGADDSDRPVRGGEVAKPVVRVAGSVLSVYLASTPLGPEVGVGAGQALSELFESLVQHFVERRPPLERVMRVLQRTDEEIEKRRADGEEVRAELFNPLSEEAAAVFEAVVDAAVRSFEERKGEAIAHLYASIAIDPDVSIADALLYLRRIRSASWRQLIALQFFGADDRQEERELIQVAATEGDAQIHPVLGAELSEMARSLGLLGIEATNGEVLDPSDISGGGEITSKAASKIRPTGLGESMSALSRLEEVIVPAELDGIAADLRRPSSASGS